MRTILRLCGLLGVAAVVLAAVVAAAGELVGSPRDVSPALGIIRTPRTPRTPDGADLGPGPAASGSIGGAYPAHSPTIDGRGNNLSVADMGAAGMPLARWVDADYADGLSAMAGAERPGAREISNAICDQGRSLPNGRAASDFLWQWGQFLDHDIDLTDGTDPPEPAHIPVPAGDPFFDPTGTGTATISFNRSLYDHTSDDWAGMPRRQINEVTSWIDASNVYGADAARAAALRTHDGSGRLATSDGNLLPFNTAGLSNAGGSSPRLFLAGDVRANEQVGLTAMHTLFVREHNRLAAMIASEDTALAGDEIYDRARRLVIAQMQIITYEEFLPVLLGATALSVYGGYDESVDASISTEFSTAAYRFGHSALSPTLLRVDAHGAEVAEGHLALRDAFFSPSRIIDEGGIEPLLRGLAAQVCQGIDVLVIDDVRNFLFGPPGSGGFDLASLNIQRGRDHGLPAYHDTRRALGLTAAASFADINPDSAITDALASVYASVEEIDLWVGALAEAPLPGAMVGELIHSILVRQFAALRDGDRFWYERMLAPGELERVKGTRLADVIRRNTNIGYEIRDDVFFVAPTAHVCPDESTRLQRSGRQAATRKRRR